MSDLAIVARRRDAETLGALSDRVEVEPASIVLNVDHHLTRGGCCGQEHPPDRGLAGGTSSLGIFDAVGHRVADEVKKRLVDPVDECEIDFHFFAGDLKGDFLAEALRGITRSSPMRGEDWTKRHEPHPHRKIGELPEKGQRLFEYGSRGVVEARRSEKVLDPAARHGDFAREFHERINAGHFNAQGRPGGPGIF